MAMTELSNEERMELTRITMSTLDEWGIGADDLLVILDLPKGTRSRALRRYREDTPFPDEPGVMKRVEYILSIAQALHTSYPHFPQMAARWMNEPHRRFNQRSPVKTLIEDGMNGLMAVRAEVDCSWAWDQSGSHT